MNSQLYAQALKASEFIRKHHPVSEAWEDRIGWCAWYISNGFMVGMHAEDKSILALAAARPVNCPEDGDIPYKFALDGPCIYFDLLVVSKPDKFILPAFTIEMIKRFGKRDQVAFRRVKVHDYNTFLRNISRINIGNTDYVPAQPANTP